MTIITFTGHRDVAPLESELERLVKHYAGALWLLGGAPGADTFVEKFLKARRVAFQVVRLDYKKYSATPKVAPLKRNEAMVDTCDIVVAAYDGRKTGGTYYTVEYAKTKGVFVDYVKFERIITPKSTPRIGIMGRMQE